MILKATISPQITHTCAGPDITYLSEVHFDIAMNNTATNTKAFDNHNHLVLQLDKYKTL
jgi:hypothetical protein